MELEYDPLVSFGRHLAETRRKAGVSQETLAYDSGLSRSYVGEIERGLRNVALRNICLLAATLGLPPSALMEFKRIPLEASAKDKPRKDKPAKEKRLARGDGSGRAVSPRKTVRAGAAGRIVVGEGEKAGARTRGRGGER